MTRFYPDFYQERRDDFRTYAIGQAERTKKESIFIREKLCKLFKRSESENYEDVLKKDKDWWTFYHLSNMRRGLFSWYDFKEDARLLEVDADFGALTGEFCDRCAEVVATESSIIKAKAIANRYKKRKNLTVYAGAVEDFDYNKFYGQFDYIVLYNVLEKKGYGYSEKKAYREYLDLIKSFLKKDGKILLVTTNRYGIRYICGARDRYTGKAFDGINHYPNGTEAYAFEKGELQDLLKQLGFTNYKFFYPIPDASVPQMICTDENFCNDIISERVTFYDIDDETLVARERCLYQDFMNNGVFGYFANSFFVEIALNGKCSDVRYAILSSDRGKKRSFSTIVYHSNIVRKKPMYEEGKEILDIYIKNMERLEKRGIKIVEHHIEQQSIVMPYIEAVTLAEELKRTAKINKEHFFKLFDLLYENILKSSSYVEENYSEQDDVILEKCYFDMIPVNCFYVNGELKFFDQEFVRYNCSAKYVMYRAIKYTYMSMWELENYIPKQLLIEKYQLDTKWEEFEIIENDFINNIRNKEITGQLDLWSYTDEEKIYNKGNILELNKGNIFIKKTPEWLLKVQVIQLRILKKFISICEKYNLKYYAYYGTLLGTVRHRGFIPWDDDVDIVMPRIDYNRLLAIASEELNGDFFLQTPLNEPECFYGGYSRLCYTQTTAIEIRNWLHDINHGIWLDILPLDDIMENLDNKKNFYDEIHELQKIILAKVYGENETLFDLSQPVFSEYKKRAEKYDYNCLQDKLMRKMNSLRNENYVTILASYNLKNCIEFPKSYFGNGIKMSFEGIDINVPDEYEKILEKLYGLGYLNIPSIEKQVQKHAVFFNADVPYEKYLHRFEDIYINAEQMQYIIVGTSELADTFIDKNHQKIKIIFVVDDEDIKQETFWGYPIKKIKDIYSIPKNERKVVICERHFRTYEEKLKQAGIDDYYIYIHDKWWLLGNNE